MHSNIRVVDYDLVCAAGVGLEGVRSALVQQKTGLISNNFPDCALNTYIGKVADIDEYSWPETEADWQSRNNADRKSVV